MRRQQGSNSAARGASGPVGLAIGFELALGLLALTLVWLFGSPLAPLISSIDSAEPAWRGVIFAVAQGILATLPLLGMLLILDRFPGRAIARLRRTSRRLVRSLFHRTRWWHWAAVAVAAGVGEELLFRGWLLSGLQHAGWFGPGPWPAAIASAVAFGICHWLSATYAVLAMLVGLYLGAVFIWSGGLLAPIIAHALYDFIALAYLMKRGCRP